MKVNSVLWLYALSVVFLCIFEFGSSATTSVGRPPTSSTTPTPANSRSSIRKQPKARTNNTIEGIVRRNIGSSRTGVSRPSTTQSLDATIGSKTKAVRQLDIPPDRKKSTFAKKYTTEGKLTFLESTRGPTKVDIPKPTFPLPEKRSSKNTKNTGGPIKVVDFPTSRFPMPSEKRSSKSPKKKLICPRDNEVKFDLFPQKCERNKDCSRNSNEICCSIFGAKSCVAGLPKPLEESTHSPIFGIIPRHCPQRPLAELWWEVKTCETDMDCWPRVCCPDGQKRYCRSSKPELDIVPVPVKRSINYLSEYLECTPAPPPIFDLHPKSCNSTIDCFPNICCQEAGKKHCRPPKKSVLTVMANFLNLGLVKRLTKNLVIK